MKSFLGRSWACIKRDFSEEPFEQCLLGPIARDRQGLAATHELRPDAWQGDRELLRSRIAEQRFFCFSRVANQRFPLPRRQSLRLIADFQLKQSRQGQIHVVAAEHQVLADRDTMQPQESLLSKDFVQTCCGEIALVCTVDFFDCTGTPLSTRTTLSTGTTLRTGGVFCLRTSQIGCLRVENTDQRKVGCSTTDVTDKNCVTRLQMGIPILLMAI